MTGAGRSAMLALAVWLGASVVAAAQTTALSGQVTRQDGTPLPGVMVLVEQTGGIEWTATDGVYRFAKIDPGTYTLLLTLGGYSINREVTVTGGTPARADVVVDWPLSFVETMVVQAPSRQAERLIDAPASVLALDAQAIERLSGQAQLPALLSAAAGVQAPQSGLYDFNVSARGFNDLVSRRVRVEVDGRDTSQPHVMGNTDWASLPQALGEFEQLEFVRGPGGALYGQGALNGVLSLRTKDPSRSAGGRARLTFGELGTVRGDARHAGRLGEGWYFKAVSGYMSSGDFAVSRDQRVEYAAGRLPLEVVPLASDRLHIAYGSARLDRHINSSDRVEIEGGTTYKEGPVTLTNLGRFQATDTNFPWLRGRYQSPAWQVTGGYTLADIDAQLSLAAGTPSYQRATNIQLDGQTTRTLARGRTRIVAGGSYNRQRVDSADRQGVQTVFEAVETAQSGSAYGQVEHDLTPRVQVSAAARVDGSSLTRTTFSPRAALLWEAAPGHRVRVAYSDAYKAPTIAELRLRAPVLAPVDLSGLEAALAPVLGGTPLGFSSVPVLAVGNESLDVEQLRSLEAGYSVVVGTRTFVQAAYYHNWHDTFTSGLLPQVGTSLGRLNPDFGPYRPPSTLSAAQSAIVQATLAQALPPSLYAVMSNFDDGRPVFALLSLGNFGSARTQGFEASSMTLLPSGWRLDVAYSWFDASVDVDAPETPLQPNTPSNQASAAVHYSRERFDAGGRLRVVDGFDWVSGVFAGPVPSYAVVDLQARFPLRQHMTVGIDVANALDNDHYEVFGGDLLGRRALAHLTLDW